MNYKFLILSTVLMMSSLTFAATTPTSNPIVKIETSMGDIFIEVFADKAPISAKNFLDYVQEGYYEGTIFHRIIPGFMNQGGGMMTGLEVKKTRPPIQNEAGNGLSNRRGTLAMARTSVVDSATSQFFINTVDNLFLDHKGNAPAEYGYAVFAKVVDGMDVVDRMAKVKTHWVGPYGDVPVEDVIIRHTTLISPVTPASTTVSSPVDVMGSPSGGTSSPDSH